MAAASARTRARDLDRTSACAALDAAYAEGQIDAGEHATRVRAATSARTLGELRALVADLQAPDAPRDLRSAARRGARGRARLVGAVVSLALLGGGFALGRVTADPATALPAPPFMPGAGSPDRAEARVVGVPDLHSPDGLTQLVAQFRETFGTARVVDLTLYPDYASIEIAVDGSPTRTRSLLYRGGFQETSTGTRDPDEALVDLDALNITAVLGLLEGAPQSLAVPDPTSRYLIYRDLGDGPEVAIHASNEFRESGHLTATPDGIVIAVHPYAP